MARLIFDCSNLSIHRTKFIRTGIQEVVYRTLLSLARVRGEFPGHEILLLPQLPQRFDGELAIPYQNPLPYMLEEVEAALGLSSREVWGFDLRARGYALPDEELIDLIATGDRVHVQSMVNIAPLAQAMRKRRPQGGPKLSITVYDLVPVLFPEYCDHGLARWFQQKYVPALGRYADQAVCISRNTALDVAENPDTRGIPAITVLPLPFEFAAALGASSESDGSGGVLGRFGLGARDYLLSLGTLEPRKNFPAILKGFELFCARNPSSSLRLALVGGTGWKNSEVEKLIARSSARDRITRTGYLSDADLEVVLAQALAVTMLSVYEGYGLPVAQAYSKGVPVITSQGSSLPEACGGQGLFVEPHDPESICAGIAMARQGYGRPEPREAAGWTWDNYARNLVRAMMSAV